MKTTITMLRLLAVSLFLAATSGLVQADLTYGTVKNVTGDVTLILPHGKAEKITKATPIPAGCMIETSMNSKIAIQWMPGAYSVIKGTGKVSVIALAYSETNGVPTRKIVLDLSKGTIYSHLAHHDGKSEFRIDTPKGVATAVGTDWVVTVDDNEAVSVAVEADSVSFLTKTTQITIKEGFLFAVTSDGSPVPLTAAQVADIVNELQLQGIAVTAPASGQTTDLLMTSPLAEVPLTKDQIVQNASR